MRQPGARHQCRPVSLVGRRASRGIRLAAASLPSMLLACSPQPAYAGDWSIAPRVTAQEILIDNVLLTSTNRRADLITTLAPGLSISGEGLTYQLNPTLTGSMELQPPQPHVAARPVSTHVQRYLDRDPKRVLGEEQAVMAEGASCPRTAKWLWRPASRRTARKGFFG